MDKILHPTTGEKGFFCTELEKEVIDVVFEEFKASLYGSLRSSESGELNG